MYSRRLCWFLALLAVSSLAAATEHDDEVDEVIAAELELQGGAGAAASNPLAAVNNTDLKTTYFRVNDAEDSRAVDYWIKGGWTFATWGKLSYELTYTETNITGSSEQDWKNLSLKPIFFFKQGQIGSWRYKMATGFEWILDFDNEDKGIGTGSDQIAPLLGIALNPRPGTTLVPLVQHFVDYNGSRDINTTGFRLIGIQKLPRNAWTKLDLIVPRDWENDTTPAIAEVELGMMQSPTFGLYLSAIAGIGSDRNVDWGGSVNMRFSY